MESQPSPPAIEAARPYGRRIVLSVVGLGAVGFAIGGPLQGAIDALLSPVRRVDPTGLSSLVPGEGGWRYYSVTAQQPDLTTADYRLSIDGLVDQPLTLTWDDIADLPQTSWTRDFQCVTGWRVDDAAWQGVELRALLEAAGVQSAARAVTFYSHDGAYTESLTIEQVEQDEVMVATHLDGAVISRDHGGPVRLLVVPMYGYKSLKWLSRIELVDTVNPGYWEERGYDVDAYVGSSNGRNDDPVT
ncbi:MAG: molybdopterin-dependent oxidoreductase [Actinomycetia bacterium]|nr:molybdopterin-dependent oxidoreductase [Actinomycetes bacterium]